MPAAVSDWCGLKGAVVHGDDVAWRDLGLDLVGRCEDEATAIGHVLDEPSSAIADLLLRTKQGLFMAMRGRSSWLE